MRRASQRSALSHIGPEKRDFRQVRIGPKSGSDNPTSRDLAAQSASWSERDARHRGPQIDEKPSTAQNDSKYIRPHGIPTEQVKDGPNHTRNNHVMEDSSNALSPKSGPVLTHDCAPAQSPCDHVVKRMTQVAFEETWCSFRQGDYSNEKKPTSRHKKEWQAPDELLPTKRSEKKVGDDSGESG